MSQFFIDASAGPPPPGTVTDLTGDTGTNPVSPDGAHNINVFGDPTAPGIVTRGDAASNTVFFGLEQPVTCGTGQTINTGTADLVTIALGASAGTFTLSANVGGKAATQSGIGGSLFATFRTDGATATVINSVDSVINSDLVLAAASFTFVTSAGSVILRATGALGTVINWKGCVTYLSVIVGI
jgi:hypothetical protein